MNIEVINEEGEEETEFIVRNQESKQSNSKKITAFQNVVKRIQIVAQLSKVKKNEDFCYDEDAKLYNKLQVKNQRTKKGSLLPIGYNVVESLEAKNIRRQLYVSGRLKFFQKDLQHEVC